ncbi:hypothetical protein AHF37_11997 [Paragonimus kellicotti]|nr:hypothetical protein AHF37_11997 [Paragonimus kellicotti]
MQVFCWVTCLHTCRVYYTWPALRTEVLH